MWKIVNYYVLEVWFILELGGGKYEDDGYFVFLVLNGEVKSSYFVFIDVWSMEMVNFVEILMIVLFNFYGWFFDDLF